MTTIFLEIAKILLVDKLSAEKLRSQQADRSLLNSVGTLFGMGRNQDLSKAKQAIIDSTVFEIKKFEGLDSDKDNCKALQDIIDKCRNDAKKASTEKHKDESEHGKAMIVLKATLLEIYDCFSELENPGKSSKQESDKSNDLLNPVKLLDVPRDTEPSHVFNYYLALYLAKRKEQIFYHKKELLGFSIEGLGIEKEELVIKYLSACAVSLDRLDKSHKDYKIERGIRVKSFLKELIDKNDELCRQYSWVPKIPVDFMLLNMTFNLPEVGPDSGFLEICLQRAKSKIDEQLQIPNENQFSAVM